METKHTFPVRRKMSQAIRQDAWINPYTGFGAKGHDPIANTEFWRNGPLSHKELDDLYREDWVSRKIVDMPANDMIRAGVSWFVENEEDTSDAEDYANLLTEYQCLVHIENLIKLSRLYGGGALVLNIDDGGDFSEPLNEKTIRKIRWVRVVHRHQCVPSSWITDMNDSDFGKPQHYQVTIPTPTANPLFHAHHTRIIPLNGIFLPDSIALQNQGWGESILQVVYNALRNFQVSSQSGATTMEDFTYKTLKIENLADLLMDKDDDTLIKRVVMAAAKLTTHNIAVYGREEELEKKTTTVTGLAELMDRFGDYICAAADIPKSRFFGNQSGTLGANASESDITNYYDRIAYTQRVSIRPIIQRFSDLISLAEKIEIGRYQFNFNNLWEPSDQEKVNTRLTQAQADQIYLQNQVVTPEEVALSRFSKREIDLHTMNIEEELRDEPRSEFNEEDEDEETNDAPV